MSYITSVPSLGTATINPNGLNAISPALSISDSSAVMVNGSIKVNGRDILQELDEMRDALLLLKRDVDMEKKYPKLKELADAYYRQLRKYQTFDLIKESA
jgi:hypothetical protein